MKKIAVVLSGCGHRDGSEIREAVATLWALSAGGAEAHCFAPNAPQAKVVNPLTGEPQAVIPRNQLEEAARIARGDIKPLKDLDPKKFDGIALPGGFGAALNLSTFATKGANGAVIPDLQNFLQAFLAAKKPIAAICIAPAIIALALRGQKLTLTVGEAGEASQEIEKLGHHHEVCKVTDSVYDSAHRVATTPAYMYPQAKVHEVFQGIQKCIDHLLVGK